MTKKSRDIFSVTGFSWHAPIQGQELARACMSVVHKELGSARESYGTLRSKWQSSGYYLPPDGQRACKYAYDPGVLMSGGTLTLTMRAEERSYAYIYHLSVTDGTGREHYVFGARGAHRAWSVLEWLTGRAVSLQERREAAQRAGITSWAKRPEPRKHTCPHCGGEFETP